MTKIACNVHQTTAKKEGVGTQSGFQFCKADAHWKPRKCMRRSREGTHKLEQSKHGILTIVTHALQRCLLFVLWPLRRRQNLRVVGGEGGGEDGGKRAGISQESELQDDSISCCRKGIVSPHESGTGGVRAGPICWCGWRSRRLQQRRQLPFKSPAPHT